MSSHSHDSETRSSSCQAGSEANGSCGLDRTVGDLAVVSTGLGEAAERLTQLAGNMKTTSLQDRSVDALLDDLASHVAQLGKHYENLSAAVMQFSLAYEDHVAPGCEG